jgi:hypothetical protein
MNRNYLSLYKKYTVDGNLSIFKKNQYVVYEDKVFKFIYPISDLSKFNWSVVPEPKNSQYWKEESVENVYSESSSSPSGIKLLGDRWKNTETNQVYTWIKSGINYIWISS